MNDRANALLSGKTYNLDKLNYLAKRLDSFDKNELTTFYAVAYSEKNNDIDRFINHTFNTHCYSVVRDFSDLDSIGKDMYLTQQGGVTMEELNRLDGEGYFKKVLGDNPNEYKKIRMQHTLSAAGMKETPEEFTAYAILKSGRVSPL